MSLAVRLAPALEVRGLTLEDVAERTSFDLLTLKEVERGRYKAFRITTLEVLREAIGCEIGELFVERP